MEWTSLWEWLTHTHINNHTHKHTYVLYIYIHIETYIRVLLERTYIHNFLKHWKIINSSSKTSKNWSCPGLCHIPHERIQKGLTGILLVTSFTMVTGTSTTSVTITMIVCCCFCIFFLCWWLPLSAHSWQKFHIYKMNQNDHRFEHLHDCC